MSLFLLVRHAQASFLDADYDKLSAIGRTQARALGDYWARQGIVFHRVFSGPRERHLQTAAIVRETFGALRSEFPEPLAMREFDEYAGDSVLQHGLPRLLEEDGAIRDLYHGFESAPDGDRRRSFQKLFEAVIGRWVEGEISLPDVEPWPDFCSRVNRGLSEIMAPGIRGERVVIFSSGGPIAVAMQRALNLSARDTLRVTWMSRNCSFSEFLSSPGRFTLSTFNAFPHLSDPSLLTYR